jgi:O-antigen ligase
LRDAPKRVLFLLACWFLLAPLSLAWSVDARLTLEELRAETLYGALAFFVFFVLADDAARWRAWWIAIFSGTLITIFFRELQQSLGIALWHNPPDGGVGAFSTHLVLISPLLAAIVWNPPWGLGRKAWVLAVSLVLLIGVAWTTREPWTTPNRIVWPSLAAVFLAAVIAGRKARAELGSGMRSVIVIAAIAISVAFVASIAAKNERFYREDPSMVASVERDLRPRLWTIAWEQWKEAPWLGHGFGREILAGAFLPETPKNVRHPPVIHGHNMFLNIALQLGLVGLAVFVALLVAMAREYLAMLSTPSLAALGVMGLALLAGFATKNLTDDFLHRHNAQLFWALNGMLLGFAARER